MQFTSLFFIFVFLPILITIYYLVKADYRNIVLIVMSLFFYSTGSCECLGILCAATMITVTLGHAIFESLHMHRIVLARIGLVAGTVGNVCLLGYYKYYNERLGLINLFVGKNTESHELFVPLGLSFFVFKSISYIVDIYSGKIEKFSVTESISYLSFFAQIQSGPISRYGIFNDNKTYSPKFFAEGVYRFAIGFSKKIIIADTLSHIVIEVFDQTIERSMSLSWLGSICFSLQLYYDFSGYSDMAIGIGQMLGIRCKENFNFPYASQTVSEFWRRWHISLGEWFRDYIYIPLGGSRKGKLRIAVNLFVVWLLTGIWHGTGTNYIAWGIGYFTIIYIEKLIDIKKKLNNKVKRFIYRLFVLLFVNIQWVMFRTESLFSGLEYVKSMLCGVNETCDIRALFLLRDYAFIIIAAILLAIPYNEIIEKTKYADCKLLKKSDLIIGMMVIGSFIVALSFVIGGNNNPFMYGNF